jgi:hypothetical protein
MSGEVSTGGSAGSAAPASSGGGVSSGGGGSSSSPSTSGKGNVSATTGGLGQVAAKVAGIDSAKGRGQPPPQQAAGAPGDDSAPLTAAEKRELLELDIDGEVIEYDYSDRERLKRDLQRRFGAEKRMAEAAKIREQAESFVESLKANPVAALSQLGIDVRGMSEGYLKQQIEQEMLKEQDPARWQLEQERQKLEQERAEVEKYKQAEQQRQFEAAKKHAAQTLEKKFMEALNLGGLPKTPFTVKRMAEYQKQARANGYDLDTAELAELVRNDFTKDIRETLGNADGAQLLKLLGDELATKLREADVARFQRPTAAPIQGRPSGERRDKAPKRMTIQEFMSRNG